MRFMMLMIPSVYQGKNGQSVPRDFAPGKEDVAKMTKFNDELAKAGVLIGLDGLRPTTHGARVSFSGGRPQVTQGPFTNTNDVLGGYWMIDVKTREEAVDWARRCPAQDGDIIEIRQVFEMSDFPPEVRKAAGEPVVQAKGGRQKGRTRS